MPLSFRAVRTEDIPLICTFPQSEDELYYMYPKASFPLSHSQLQEAIEQRADSTVIELDGQVVGFANFYHCEDGGRCSLGNVIVSPAARGKGVARYLVERMIEIALDKHQASEVTLSCFNQNVPGLLLYPQLGFVPFAIEERRNKQGERVALIHMRLQR
ncbi:GNAT family N-acetyltransferase [Pseudomonas sp. LS1212]|uniref:GNAT family N-acetyltransferase n=1 Tax=Pseudomonas sp. LS1212 TaxID=2972478 RepID=UPI00215CA5E0|nr:GNAT family N-acetyltransferase [Pseudomonas sp. LS1212]UVJ44968.1 GNAT family N-acetyltransferase [Pseudomonas sp. LS1212]